MLWICDAGRNLPPVGGLVGGVDRFKALDRKYGFEKGDAALREVARRLREAVRPYDAVGRYGGDEFVIVLRGASLEDARNLAECLRQRLEGETIRISDSKVSLTASFGVATQRCPMPISMSCFAPQIRHCTELRTVVAIAWKWHRIEAQIQYSNTAGRLASVLHVHRRPLSAS